MQEIWQKKVQQRTDIKTKADGNKENMFCWKLAQGDMPIDITRLSLALL